MSLRLAWLGGKGGVGKTNLAVNFAIAASALGGRVLLVDGDVGLANVDVLLGLVPKRDVSDVLAGTCSVDEALVTGPSGVSILPATSGRCDLAGARVSELSGLLSPILANPWGFELILIDAGSGIGPTMRALTACCDRGLLVTSPEPTSLTDAYATLKVVKRDAPTLPVSLIVNQCNSPADAGDAATRIQRVAQRFLGANVPLEMTIPMDPQVPRAVQEQRAWVEAFPGAPASRAIVELAHRYLAASRQKQPRVDESPAAP